MSAATEREREERRWGNWIGKEEMMGGDTRQGAVGKCSKPGGGGSGGNSRGGETLGLIYILKLSWGTIISQTQFRPAFFLRSLSLLLPGSSALNMFTWRNPMGQFSAFSFWRRPSRGTFFSWKRYFLFFAFLVLSGHSIPVSLLDLSYVLNLNVGTFHGSEIRAFPSIPSVGLSILGFRSVNGCLPNYSVSKPLLELPALIKNSLQHLHLKVWKASQNSTSSKLNSYCSDHFIMY